MTEQTSETLSRRVEELERSRRRWRFLASLAWAALTLSLSYQVISWVSTTGQVARIEFVNDGGGSMIVDEFRAGTGPEAPATMPQADEEPGDAAGPADAR